MARALRGRHAGRRAPPRARPDADRRRGRQGPGSRRPRATRASRARTSPRCCATRDVDHVTVVGLATDYCVKNTALDALREGFSVTVDSTRDARRRRRARRLRAGAGGGPRRGSERGVMAAAPERLMQILRRSVDDRARAGGDRRGAARRLRAARPARPGVGEHPAADRVRADDLAAAGGGAHVRAARAHRRRDGARRRHRLGLPRRAARPAGAARVLDRGPRLALAPGCGATCARPAWRT